MPLRYDVGKYSVVPPTLRIHLPLPDLLAQLLQNPGHPLEIALLEVYLRAQPRPEPPAVQEHGHHRLVPVRHDGLHPVHRSKGVCNLERRIRRAITAAFAIAVAVVDGDRQPHRRHRAPALLAHFARFQPGFLEDFGAEGCGDNVPGLAGQVLQVLVDALLAAADVFAELERCGNAQVGRVVGRGDILEQQLERALWVLTAR